MACGVPPVATRVGGVPELITDGVDGYLEAVGDIPAQAARVAALLMDDSLHDPCLTGRAPHRYGPLLRGQDYSAVRAVLRRGC